MFACNITVALTQLQNEIRNCETALMKLIQKKKSMAEKVLEPDTINTQLQKNPIAIIGMASLFPQSRNTQQYWQKIIEKVDCITDVPPSRWDVDTYYDPNPRAPDKTYCKRGGFIPDIDFNPMEFGLPPNILEVTDVSQLLGLVVAKEAMEDAGYDEKRQFNRDRTGVVLGVALARQLAMPLGARLQYPVWEKALKSSGLSDADTQKVIDKIKSAYVNWEENAFPGMLANVVSGRIANRLDFGGTNCVVDAACASSLGALRMAMSELLEHRCDMMLTGGVDTDNSIVAYMCFSKTPAVSPSENVKPFDAESDGMMLGEGVGMIVLKRLADAERDGDKIYAVIKGIGTSSDGKYKSIYAPRPEGQVRALRRAYEDAGCSPASVGLIEAHGTGTMAGDPTEFSALKAFFEETDIGKQKIALGSVKSQIGHTKAAAGAASLIKTALALHHKVLPPTINVTKPNPKLKIEDSPFYLNTETRPWFQGDTPRRAGVSSFGFGGTNYHVVLEEYTKEHNSYPYRIHQTPQIVLLSAAMPEQLQHKCADLLAKLQGEASEKHFTQVVAASRTLEIPVTDARLGFVANSVTEAIALLQVSVEQLKKHSTDWEHPQGIYYRRSGIDSTGKVVALFSGQGSQYLEMGKELALNFPCLRQVYQQMDNLLSKDGLQPISDVVFPPPVFDNAQRQKQQEALQRTEYAQPAIGVFSAGLYKILQQAGFKPDFVAGHSFGELTALWAAEVLSDEDYLALVKARGQAMATPKEPNVDAGAMLAVKGDVTQATTLIKQFPLVTIANFNSTKQIVLAGTKPEITQVQQALNGQGFSTVILPVAAAFHTPLVGYAQKPFAHAIEATRFQEPKTSVYSNVTGKAYPKEPQAIQKILKEHLLNSVLFKDQIENIYASGGYFFVEFGPRNILANLVKDTLGDRPHLAVAVNAHKQQNSDRTLRSAVVQLRVAGLSLGDIDPYQLESKIPQVQGNKALNVRLNSANYISEKTQTAFAQALAETHVISSAISTTTTPAPTSATNGHHSQPISAASPEPKTVVATQPSLPQPVAVDYQKMLDSIESTLTQFNDHHGDILQVHEQSLKHQTEYAQTFYQLTQQQSLLTNQNAATRDSLERSMMRFHDHQAETLRIHEQYLQQQMEHTHNFFELIEQKYESVIEGGVTKEALSPTPVSNGNGHQANGNGTTLVEIASVPQTQEEPQIPETASVIVPPVEPAPETSIDVTELSQTLLNVVSDKTGYPVEMLELEMDMEADLGIDSIKRVEILGALLELNPGLPQPNPEELAELRTLGQIAEYMSSIATTLPVKAATVEEVSHNASATPVTPIPESPPTEKASVPETSIDAADLSQTLLNVVSDKTGYPVEMLELEMDMEADLGIDSIKRVEILGALLELNPGLPQPNPEELAELRTLGQIAEYMSSIAGNLTEEEILPKKQDSGEPETNHSIIRSVVKLKVLPPPDRLECNLPQQHVCLITDDGSALTTQLAQALTAKGEKVVVLSFPESVIAQRANVDDTIGRIVLEDLTETRLQQLKELQYGSIGTFIHLHPAIDNSEEIAYLNSEALLKHIFLIAKHLKEPLNQAASQGRSCFVTVTHLDGELGIGQKTNYSAIAGGLFGLTKTLNQEWESVFCRAIDISTDIDAQQAVKHILAEIQDPNRLISEVGYGAKGRVTLESYEC
ncbi:acyltransferase domain-containing protein [Gloeocapsopsis crepidinum LEGE 06123]|uniref:Acyltransferase domain-containing protein n=2 Tax=Gloeocapsopsis crepidinum TaxID=693223 RepID=A0ABR9UN58_9CHRO|nr:acyltransferase domain-containing protein [Gloeocapsopsis crepidinum LEGE 06123]